MSEEVASTSTSRFLCNMETLAFVLRAALKIASKQYDAVRLTRAENDRLMVSAISAHETLVATLAAEFIWWDEERDHVVEMSRHAAASLASFEVPMPKDVVMEPTVSVTIGPKRIRLQDATGLWQVPSGRDEHRLQDLVLTGDHARTITEASQLQDEAQLWVGPKQLKTISSVVQALHREVSTIARMEPAPGVSRWFVAGANWGLTISSVSAAQADEEAASERQATHEEAAAGLEGMTVTVQARPLVGMS